MYFYSGHWCIFTPALTDAMKILESLKLYTEQHFGREEELQRVVKFPYREAHHNEHTNLIKKLDSMMAETKDSSGNYLNTEVGEKIGMLLKGWLFDHVLENDLRMKPYLEEMRELAKKMGRMGR